MKTKNIDLFENFQTFLSQKNIAAAYFFVKLNYKTIDGKTIYGKNLKGSTYKKIISIITSIFKQFDMPIKFVDMANFWYRSFNNSETYYTLYS